MEFTATFCLTRWQDLLGWARKSWCRLLSTEQSC